MTGREQQARAAWLRSGCVALTGRADGPPLVPPGDAALRATEAAAPFGVDGARLLGERAALMMFARNGPWSAGGTCRAVRARDGWWALSLARTDDVAAVPALVEAEDVGDAWRAVQRWSCSRDVAEVTGRARLLGLPSGAVGERASGRSGVAVTARAAAGARSATPLVVDLSSLWAGPLCAHLLGLAGARIVKVESTHRPDGARRGDERFYDLLHAGHESVAVDLRERDGVAALHALLRAADVVIEASRPRALAQLGIDVEAVLAASPTTWVRITAYGGGEPERVGFGDDVSLVGGLSVDDRGTPLPCGDAVADPLAGIAAAAAARDQWQRPGSALIDVSLVDVVRESIGSRYSAAVAGGDVICEPTARTPRGRAPELGADTGRVLAELAVPS